jgi:hypothetical protein
MSTVVLIYTGNENIVQMKNHLHIIYHTVLVNVIYVVISALVIVTTFTDYVVTHLIFIWKVLESNHGVNCPEYGYTCLGPSKLMLTTYHVLCHEILPDSLFMFTMFIIVSIRLIANMWNVNLSNQIKR